MVLYIAVKAGPIVNNGIEVIINNMLISRILAKAVKNLISIESDENVSYCKNLQKTKTKFSI